MSAGRESDEGARPGAEQSSQRTPASPACARSVAAEVLSRVFSEGAYAAPALSAVLGRSGLQPKDRGLSTELSYGVLRTEGYLRRRIQRHAKWTRTEPLVQVHLLLGAYQIDFLDRVPEHAIVSEAVRLVRAARGERAGGFVNAVLRNLIRDRQAFRLSRVEAVLSSTPSFLRKRLLRDVGEEEMLALLAPETIPAPTLRVRPGRTLEFPPDGVESLSGSAVRFLAGGDPRRHPGYERGDFVVQEWGAQRVADLLCIKPGQRVLDVCAGRGQKSIQLIDRGARVLATDLHAHKLSQLREEFQRLGLSCETETFDWTRPPKGEWLGAFDAVLVDAPCTGVGTLRRRPEILRRLTPDAPSRLSELQEVILRHASLTLAPRGRLLFVTCSVLSEEGEEVVQRVGDLLQPVALEETVEASPLGDAVGRLLPARDGTDGYFHARLCRRSK